MDAPIPEQITSLLNTVVGSDALSWLEDSRSTLAGSQEPLATLERLFPAARRTLGSRSMTTPASITIDDATIELRDWQASDLGRALLLLEGCARIPCAELVDTLYRNGDETERSAIVRALMLLPDAAALKPVALEAGRTNSVSLFAALALDNPYPDRHYTDHEFNQLVLKALFMGLPIGRITGLQRRANAELARMCEDFYDERTAAGRPAPVDIWLAMLPHASERGLRLGIEHLSHTEPAHRFNAAIAVGRKAQDNAALRSELQRRLGIETDERVQRALQAFSWQH
jgi:hypothetical protein